MNNAFQSLLEDNLIEAAGGNTSTAKVMPIKRRIQGNPDEANEGDIRDIPITQIVVKPQHRTEFKGIAELAVNIEQNGLTQPVVVRYLERDGRFELVAGERRLRAMKHLNRETIQCLIRNFTDKEVAEIQLGENWMRDDLDPIDLALGIKDVMDKTGRSASSLAKLYGKNKTTVTRSLQLLELPEDIQLQIRRGELSPTHARELARLPDEKTQRRVLTQSRKQSLTANEVEDVVRQRVGKKRITTSSRKTKTLTFPLECGKMSVTFNSDATYEQFQEDLEVLLADIETRVKDGKVSIF